jgi:nucleotide-binding universal stress UspA family protein
MFSVIVVGTDGSDTADRTVRVAIDMAKMHASALHVVTAYSPVVPTLSAEEREALGDLLWMASPGELAERLVADAAARAASSGVEVETHVRTGDPANALIEVAESQGADVILVGSKGLTSPVRFLLGSVPSKIVHHAPCDVLVVRTT